MNISVKATNALNFKDTSEFYIKAPCVCPYCSQGIISKHLYSFYTNDTYDRTQEITAVFLCPCCEKIFVAIYHDINCFCEQTLEISQIIPPSSTQEKFSECISNLSPKFVQIYNQSFQAEQSGLMEICGMGYRKALEFLIKDYAIKYNPDKENEIKKAMLGQCIKSYIDNERIKSLATASAWIGNDETHYCRKLEDYTIESLKAFINAIVSYINSEMEVIKANELINHKN